jgi:hypothetical protein
MTVLVLLQLNKLYLYMISVVRVTIYFTDKNIIGCSKKKHVISIDKGFNGMPLHVME